MSQFCAYLLALFAILIEVFIFNTFNRITSKMHLNTVEYRKQTLNRNILYY